MRFNYHSGLDNRHALLSPSNYHWLNYDDQKMEARFYTVSSARRGTDLHVLAHEAIRLKIYLDSQHEALAAYVADGIEYNMACEQPLYYSENCFGHPDTIALENTLLRIHDLKTGVTATSVRQLEVYAALFCLEYDYQPEELEYDLRIYQRDEVRVFETPPEAIEEIIEKIIHHDQQINRLKEAQ